MEESCVSLTPQALLAYITLKPFRSIVYTALELRQEYKAEEYETIDYIQSNLFFNRT